MTPSLESKLAQVINHLEATRRPGGLKHGLDLQFVDRYLCDPEIQAWIDELNRAGVVSKGIHIDTSKLRG